LDAPQRPCGAQKKRKKRKRENKRNHAANSIVELKAYNEPLPCMLFHGIA